MGEIGAVCLRFVAAAAVTRHANAVVAVVRTFRYHPIQVQEARSLFSRRNPSKNSPSFTLIASINLFLVYFNSEFLFFFAHCFTY